MSRPRALVAWSCGKDSAFALHAVRQADRFDLVGALTTITDAYSRVSMHGVREELLDRQLDALDLPCTKVRIPSPCPNEIYEREMDSAMSAARDRGVTHVVFGDLFLEDVRDYRVAQLGRVGMECVFPLWGRDTPALAREMVESGLRAVLTCVDPRVLDQAFAGRVFDPGLLDELPAEVDPCGERGEFHTFVYTGPMLREPIDVRPGEVTERGGFVFADLLPADPR